MMDAVILGVVEGLTEFLPISSTGHLLIFQQWLPRRSDLFNVCIQCGAILAVTLVYRARIVELVSSWREPAVKDYIVKLIGSFCVTATLGLAVKMAGVELPTSVTPVAIALIVGGFVIFAVETYARRVRPADRVTWAVAIAVGFAQAVAGVFPGTSRSGAAIFAALLIGLTLRIKAAEFAFLVGIPTMFAAASYELVTTLVDPTATTAEAWHELMVAFLVAAVTGFAVVRGLLKYISRHTFVPFGWYRIALGGSLLVFGETI